jgi:DNA polymerase III alpha subunit (gram-positive type)
LILNNVEPEKNGLIRVNVAGKNVASFDLQFLKTKITKWWPISFCQRTIDPAILYWDAKRDQQLPDMKTCMERARIKGEVAHTALEDALVVVKLLRHKLLRQKTK